MKVLTVHPTERIQTQLVSGTIYRTSDMLLFTLDQTTLLEIQMNYEFLGLRRRNSKRLAELFQAEAELASDMIKRKSEEFEADISLAERLWVN